MRRHIAIMVGLGLLLALLPSARATGSGPEAAPAAAPLAAPLGSGITYQGFLKQNGAPANGLFNMQFQLFDAATGGTPLGAVSLPNVPVTNGQFTVGLDFGAGAFNGEARWLAITVGGTLLSPRQEVRAAPYALFAPTAGVATSAWSRTGNSAGAGEFLGTTNAVALELRVNNARALRLEPNGTSPNVVGGFSGNSVLQNVVGATIGGGGNSGTAPDGPNRVTDDYGTVGGGVNNRAGNDDGTTTNAPFATVGGGQFNTASGLGATVGGGQFNTASGFAATVGGGFDNTASGIRATVGGGVVNAAIGLEATVPGGFANEASGDFSFAAGRQAQALGTGTFVWNDSNTTGAPFASNTNLGTGAGQFNVSATNSFHVRATGGVRFVTNSSNNVGVYLTASGNTWLTPSHSSLKTDFAAVDTRAVLEGLVGLPLTTWRLRDEDPTVRHLGPMAEDFYAAFGLGDGDQAISTLDADGVAFAAIQGLYALTQDEAADLAAKDAELHELAETVATLQAANATLTETLAERDAALATLRAEHAALAARLAAVEQAVAAREAP